MIFIIAIATSIFTLLGGLFALKYSDKLHLILGFSAGAVLGVAFFDLMPEAMALIGGTEDHLTVTTVLAFGFGLFMILDRTISGLSHNGEEAVNETHHHDGKLGALALITHSFLDGLGIGLAFQVSVAVGAVVAVAVLVHDFSDGINTVNMILKGTREKVRALKWLAADAVAPLLGVLVGSQFILTDNQLGMVLALFAGFFFYIGASDLLPESHHRHPKPWTTISTVLGMLIIYFAITLAMKG
ncbi:MAG: ZIP family metal transporter [Candidatus Paceibacterota bacterium]|jgi:ZIP family zinc transporter